MSSELEDFVMVLCLAVGDVLTGIGPDMVGLPPILGDLGVLGDLLVSGSDILRDVLEFVCGFHPPLELGVTLNFDESSGLTTGFKLRDVSLRESELAVLLKEDFLSSPEREPVELLLSGPAFLVEDFARSLSNVFFRTGSSLIGSFFFTMGDFFSLLGRGGGSFDVGEDILMVTGGGGDICILSR